MTAKTLAVCFILAFTSSLMAAEAFIYDPRNITEKQASDSERCGPHKDQLCYNIYYDDAIIMKNIPKDYLDYFINFKKSAIRQGLSLRARLNPLDADLKSPYNFMQCFYTLSYSQVIDSYEGSEIELSCEGYLKKDYKLKLQGQFDYKIDERIHERLKTLKGSALKKSCKIKINTGFLDPLLCNYSKCDLYENFKLDQSEEMEASLLSSRGHFSQDKKIKEAPKCVICQQEGADLVLQPCNHLCAHSACWQKQTECPICRVAVQNTLQVKY